jgi:hypothetical protein
MAWIFWLREKACLCELLLKRAVEGTGIDAVGSFAGYVKQAEQFFLLILQDIVPLFASIVTDVACKGVDGDFTLFGEEFC